MELTTLNRRFLESTRGQVILALRRGPRTTGELATALGLTENAIRAHLTSLERDGQIRQIGTRQGHRKPHFEYGLTPEAEQLFPKAYAGLLSALLATLSEQMPASAVDALFDQVAARIAQGFPAPSVSTPAERVEFAVAVLNELGGLADLEPHNGKAYIRGHSCPLAAIVKDNPQACRLAEKLLSALTGLPVREHCEKGSQPRCCFEIDMAPTGAAVES